MGNLDLGRMRRLSPSLCRAEGAVVIELEFGKDEQGTRFVTGAWSTRLELACQRCLEPMGIALSREIRLELVVGTQESGCMSSDFEPMQVFESGAVSLPEMVEDDYPGTAQGTRARRWLSTTRYWFSGGKEEPVWGAR